MTPDQLVEAAHAAARIEGCDCSPEVTLKSHQDGMHHADIAHDDWCWLLKTTRL